MASYSDQQMMATVQRYLQPGEQLRAASVGKKDIPGYFFIPFIFLALLGVVLILIIWALTSKTFLIALTDRRLIVIEVSGSLAPKFQWDYALPVQGFNSVVKGGGLELQVNQMRPFKALFTGMGPTNLQNARNIAQALQGGGQMQQGAPGGYAQAPQMGPGGYGAPPGGGGYGPPPGGGGFGPPPGGGGYGPPPGGGGYGPPPGGGGGQGPGGGQGWGGQG